MIAAEFINLREEGKGSIEDLEEIIQNSEKEIKAALEGDGRSEQFQVIADHLKQGVGEAKQATAQMVLSGIDFA